MIWEAIQEAKLEENNLQVVWLDLANAYGSVPHQLLWKNSLYIFPVHSEISTMLKNYLGFCVTLRNLSIHGSTYKWA